jgi:putative copper export protein
MLDLESPLYVAIRWLTFCALLGATGSVVFVWLIRPLSAGDARRPAEWIAPATECTARWGRWLAVALVVAAVFRLAAQLMAASPEPDPALIIALLTRTTWGRGWWTQVTGAIVLGVGFSLALRRDDASGMPWITCAAAAVALAFTPAMSGHAVSAATLAPLPIIADGLHVLGAAGWLGTLAFVVLVGLPAARRTAAPDRGAAVTLLIGRFSPVALLFAALAVTTGVITTWIHLGDLRELWESPYGRTLLAKLLALTGLFWTGAYNWRRVKPALGTEASSARLRRSASIELGIALLVLLVTAVLVAVPTPSETAGSM